MKTKEFEEMPITSYDEKDKGSAKDSRGMQSVIVLTVLYPMLEDPLEVENLRM